MSQDIHVVVEHLRGQVTDITYVALAAARQLATGTGGDVAAVLLGHDGENLAGDLAADRVVYIDDPALVDFNPENYNAILADLIGDDPPRCMLFGDTSMGAEVAGVLSARLGMPLVSRCRTADAANGTLRFVSQICGGKILVEGNLPEPTAPSGTHHDLFDGAVDPMKGEVHEAAGEDS